MGIKIPFFGRKNINGARVQVQVYSATDIGLRRANNEDRCVSLEGKDSPGFADAVMIVADGMGGQAHGEVASDMAVEGVIRRLADQPKDKTLPTGGYAELLGQVFREVNAEIYLESQGDTYRGMGTTATAAVVTGTRVHIAHLGDSRAYLLRDGELSQLTRDHSWVAENVEAGNLTLEQARVHPNRNVITQAMGINAEPAVQTKTLDLRDGDLLLLCSDGLHGLAGDDEIKELLQSGKPEQAIEDLIQRAKDLGGNDNITVVIGAVKRQG